jgi:hypothetical protein
MRSNAITATICVRCPPGFAAAGVEAAEAAEEAEEAEAADVAMSQAPRKSDDDGPILANIVNRAAVAKTGVGEQCVIAAASLA